MIRFVICHLMFIISCHCALITVQTSRGSVQGFDHDFGDDTSRRFFGYGQIFLGIPYAKAPLGERRFTLPEPLCRYNDKGEVHNATYYRPRCYQTDSVQAADEMSEDCLYLNVMTPNITGAYPVHFFIHGGNFITGGADIYHWKGAVRNLVSRGVVVVTIQYRLGLIGFFTTFTERFPPNRGLYDQIMALRWINEEVAHFGGDPNRVTIFGQSSGAASVSDLSLSPLTRGLFHQLSQSSGASYMGLETIDDPRISGHKLRAEQICQINSTDWGSEAKDEALSDCLVHAKPEDLIHFDKDGKGWMAAIDGAILPDYPDILAKERPLYPALIGDMLEEFAFFFPGLPIEALPYLTRESVSAIFRKTSPNYSNAAIDNLTDMTIRAVSHGVTPANEDVMGWAKLITEIVTGAYVDSFLLKDAQWHIQAGNEDLWLFTFTHRSLLPFNLEYQEWIPVFHSSELPYLWFYPNVWETYNASGADFAVADRMGQMWTDFVKYGNLNLPRAEDSMNYVEICENFTMKSNWRTKADEVFNKQIPDYLGEFPPLKISDASWTKLNMLGERVLLQWNSLQCPKPATRSLVLRTTKRASPLLSHIALAMLMLTQCLRLLQNIRH